MRVMCYRNLNRKGVVWSVKNLKSGLVIDRATTVHLKDCELFVSQAGRRRVLKNKKKNVHAGPRGERITRSPSNLCWMRLKYNPYVNERFVDEAGRQVLKAEYVKLTKTGCWAAGLITFAEDYWKD